MILILLFLLPCIICHQTTRFQGTLGLGYKKSISTRSSQGYTSTDKYEKALEYFDTVANCAIFCRKLGDCEAFETLYIQNSTEVSKESTFRGFRCSIPEKDFQTEGAQEGTQTTLWQVRTDKSSKRSVASISDTSPSECPTIWKHWSKENHDEAAPNKPWRYRNSNDLSGITNMFDGLTTTSFKTGESSFPWIKVDMKRLYLLTKVAILSGEEPLMNLEIRFGESGLNMNYFSGGNERITETNERCGMYYGPTLVPQQWVEVDCGFSQGIKGRYLYLQLLERYGGNNPLEITTLELYGWGRACGNKDPDP